MAPPPPPQCTGCSTSKEILGGKGKPRGRGAASLFSKSGSLGLLSCLSCLVWSVSSSTSLSRSCFPSVFKYECLPPKFSVPSLCNWLPFSSRETALPKVKTDILINQPNGYFLNLQLSWPLWNSWWCWLSSLCLLRCWAWLARECHAQRALALGPRSRTAHTCSPVLRASFYSIPPPQQPAWVTQNGPQALASPWST